MVSTGASRVDDEGTRYWAFLSYSHADHAIATRLHKALEAYVMPSAVRKAHALPRRLIPVFLDLEELEAASALSARLEQALDLSRWLIVLCTPAAAKSRYVNEEIECFIGKHGAKRVLCVLAEGEPAQSFPPAIKALADEPLAADLRKDFGLGVLRIIAAMAMVGFTDLRNREAQRRRRQRLIAGALMAGVALGGLACWDLLYREHVDYYTNYVRRHGIWEGVDTLSADEASHRNASYRFTRNGRLHPPRRVDYLNGSGRCLVGGMNGPLGTPSNRAFGTLMDGYCTVRFAYREGGALAREDWLNSTGALFDSLTYTEEGLAQFTLRGFATSETRSGIYYVQAVRDEDGFDRRVEFLHALGAPRQNERHEFGWALDYDDAGRVIRRSVLDDHGVEAGPVTHYRHDDRGLIVEQRNTDLKNQAQIDENGFASQLTDYDERGNPSRDRFLLAGGGPAFATVMRPPQGWTSSAVPAVVSGLASIWDDRGNLVEWRLLDGNGNAVNSQLGFAILKRTFDELGNLVREQGFDAQFRPAPIEQDGTASVSLKYDADNSFAERHYFDAAGEPLAPSVGSAITRYSYDRHHFRECWFDGQEHPLMIQYGACLEWLFDERGAPIGLDFFDTKNQPYARADSGVASNRMFRDDRGNIVGNSTRGADMKPVINRWYGRASFENTVDDAGNPVESRSYDIQHRLMRNKDGIAICRRKFDRFGHKVEETYFDEYQRPLRNKFGLFGFRAKYDDRGRLIQKDFIDAAGAPTPSPFSAAYGERYEYDGTGRVSADVYLSRDGHPSARLERQRDAYGNEIRDRYVDAGGRAASHPATRCATELFSYDRYNRVVEKRCLDANERLVNRKDGGWAMEKITSSVSGVNDEKYFDASGRPVTPKKV